MTIGSHATRTAGFLKTSVLRWRKRVTSALPCRKSLAEAAAFAERFLPYMGCPHDFPFAGGWESGAVFDARNCLVLDDRAERVARKAQEFAWDASVAQVRALLAGLPGR